MYSTSVWTGCEMDVESFEDVSNHERSPFSDTYDEYLCLGTLSDGKSHLFAISMTGIGLLASSVEEELVAL